MNRWFCTLTLSLLVGGLPLAKADNVELVEAMSALQYFTHKTSLAVDARNAPLAAFYAHELEEILEQLESVESYHGHPIAKLVEAMLVPSFEQLESAVKAEQWTQSSAAVDRLIDSCNQCHSATQHGFIQIERTTHNPYFQTF